MDHRQSAVSSGLQSPLLYSKNFPMSPILYDFITCNTLRPVLYFGQ
jgi:hypothetical protein